MNSPHRNSGYNVSPVVAGGKASVSHVALGPKERLLTLSLLASVSHVALDPDHRLLTSSLLPSVSHVALSPDQRLLTVIGISITLDPIRGC